MEITRQDETQLVIEVNLIQYLFGRNFMIAISVFLLVSFCSLLNDPSSAGFQILLFSFVCVFIVLISGEEVFITYSRFAISFNH